MPTCRTAQISSRSDRLCPFIFDREPFLARLRFSSGMHSIGQIRWHRSGRMLEPHLPSLQSLDRTDCSGFCGRRRSCLCRKRAHKETARENKKSSDIGGADVSKIFERRFLVQGLPGGADDAADDDNLICIKDQDVATAFAIEAMRLTDHYNFRSVREPDIGPPNQKPKALDDTGTWVKQILRSG